MFWCQVEQHLLLLLEALKASSNASFVYVPADRETSDSPDVELPDG